jgi:hypothetical protein
MTATSDPSKQHELVAALHAALFAQTACNAAAKRLADEETTLKEAIAKLESLMAEQNMTGVTSSLGSADIGDVTVYKAEDWTTFYKHIASTGEFDLLHKREGQTALKDRDSNNALPPGIKKVTFKKLKLTVGK